MIIEIFHYIWQHMAYLWLPVVIIFSISSAVSHMYPENEFLRKIAGQIWHFHSWFLMILGLFSYWEVTLK